MGPPNKRIKMRSGEKRGGDEGARMGAENAYYIHGIMPAECRINRMFIVDTNLDPTQFFSFSLC